jgi:hypothetical protein
MTTTLEESVSALRSAVETRLAGTPADDPKMTGYQAESCCDGGRCHPMKQATPSVRPGTDAFLSVLEELSALHLRKTLDYGVEEDALANIRNSADVINVPAYAGCVLRMSDKMHRLKAFFRRGQVEFDGVEDTLLDLAAYSVIALVLYRESLE